MKLRLIAIALLLPLVAFAEPQYNWQKLEGCALIADGPR